MTLTIKIITILAIASIATACSKSTDSRSSQAGTGGSLAKFTISSGYLYTVNYSELKSYDISNPAAPVYKHTASAPQAQTIFSYNDNLFIGARDGIFIYDISNPSKPTLKGQASHLRACDPVIAEGTYAYSTLQGSSTCGNVNPGLYVYDITNIMQPVLKQYASMPKPKGLGLAQNTLYVCGEEYGMTIFDVSNPESPKEKKVLKDDTSYQDVIVAENALICYVNSGLLLYDITDRENPILLQKINQ
ncbi:LVIVD repeat-containing protein [Filimonas effusa]|uniref:LVIVD repeat-containing protein n=1 Tax=Filimonas effusa TaxID=2508721 RepID=A0A4V1MAH8_9BACT|nr:hypothetical protein [Filimonas effusa]RXK85926.1 hypothetical protein ESB13_03700 [Filimonas effusa]